MQYLFVLLYEKLYLATDENYLLKNVLFTIVKNIHVPRS